jgi:hypothetical protein
VNDDPMAMTRRTLLAWFGGGMLATLAWPGPVTEAAAAEGDAAVAAALARIGRRYLELAPAERDPATLRAQLGPLATPADVLGHAAALEQAVRRDFERGDILAVDGWILSRTELRVAASFALAAPRAS